MQDQGENREYVMERGPIPNVPVYVVCPRDGEGCIQTLHRNYLLPISPNLEQSKMDKPVAGVGNDTSVTPVPPVSDAPVGVNCLGWLPQAQQAAHQKIVQIDLLPSGMALKVDDAGLTGIWDTWVGLCISLYMVFCLCTALWKEYSAIHTLLTTTNVCKHNSPQHPGEHP